MPFIAEPPPQDMQMYARSFLDELDRKKPSDGPSSVILPPIRLYRIRVSDEKHLDNMRADGWKIYAERGGSIEYVVMSGPRGRNRAAASRRSASHVDHAYLKISKLIDEAKSANADFSFRIIEMPWYHMAAIWVRGYRERFHVLPTNILNDEMKVDVELDRRAFFDAVRAREMETRCGGVALPRPNERATSSLLIDAVSAPAKIARRWLRGDGDQ